MRAFGIGLTLASAAAAVAYVAVSAASGTTMDPIGDNLYLAAVMALLVTKWSVSLAAFSRKYRISFEETEGDVLV